MGLKRKRMLRSCSTKPSTLKEWLEARDSVSDWRSITLHDGCSSREWNQMVLLLVGGSDERFHRDYSPAIYFCKALVGSSISLIALIPRSQPYNHIWGMSHLSSLLYVSKKRGPTQSLSVPTVVRWCCNSNQSLRRNNLLQLSVTRVQLGNITRERDGESMDMDTVLDSSIATNMRSIGDDSSVSLQDFQSSILKHCEIAIAWPFRNAPVLGDSKESGRLEESTSDTVYHIGMI